MQISCPVNAHAASFEAITGARTTPSATRNAGSSEIVNTGRQRMALADMADEALVALARREPASADPALHELFGRCYPKVAGWCLRFCGDREEAADVAQEVFLKVHARLDTYRLESRFSTWLYTITRRVVIDRGQAARRREKLFIPEEAAPAPAPAAPDEHVVEHLSREQVLDQLKTAMDRDLGVMEARVVYLHYVDGMSLPAITRFLELDNKSGAKAYLVGGMRKLRRHFKPWLERQSGFDNGTGS